MRTPGLLIAATIALASASASAQSAGMPDVSAFAVGDVWQWREIDNLTKLESPGRNIVIVEDKGVRKAMVDGVPRALTFPYVFEPSPKPWRVWPLEVGRKWTIDVDFVQPDGVKGNIKQEARVVAYEEVSVPAGKFMAFRIEQDGFLRFGNFSGRMVDTYWYAPVAMADVRHTRHVGNRYFTRELVKYPAPAAQRATAPQGTTAAAPAPPGAAIPPPAADGVK